MQAPLVAPMLPCFVSTCPLWQTQYCASLIFQCALNPPRIIAPATHSRGHVSVAGVGVETVIPPLPTPPAVYSIICYGGRQKKADHRACTVRAHTPATRTSTATATPITFNSTTAN